MDTLFCDSLSESDFLYNPDGGMPHSHAATLLETAEGNLLAVWYAYPETENVSAHLVLASRHKGSTEWAPTKILLASQSYSLGNPVLYQTKDGTIWLFYVALMSTWWNSAALNFISSQDGGLTWSRPASMGPWIGLMIRHPPVCLPNNDLLLPAYDETKNITILLRSPYPYLQWEESRPFETNGLIQPSLIAGPKGNLEIFFRVAQEPSRMWRSTSKDQGRSWAPPVMTTLVNPLSGIAAVTAHGVLGVIHNPVENKRSPLAISLSLDEGTTWGEPRLLDTAQFEVSYPSFIVGQNNIIRGVYTFNRRMIKYVAFPATLLSYAAK